MLLLPQNTEAWAYLGVAVVLGLAGFGVCVLIVRIGMSHTNDYGVEEHRSALGATSSVFGRGCLSLTAAGLFIVAFVIGVLGLLSFFGD